MQAEVEPKPRRRRTESPCGAPVARSAAWVGPYNCSYHWHRTGCLRDVDHHNTHPVCTIHHRLVAPGQTNPVRGM